MDLVIGPWFIRINVKSPKFSLCLNYTKSGVGLLKIDLLACPTRLGEPN